MKYKFTIFLSLYLVTVLGQAQVTIGSAKKPVDGALLMLDDAATNGGSNSSKGLGLPRVNLSTRTPEPNKLAESIGSKSTTNGVWNEKEHIGLIVYNAEAPKLNFATCKMEGTPIGLYVWDGNMWAGIGIMNNKEIIHYYKDERNPNDIVEYPYRNFGSEAGDWMLQNMRATKFDSAITTATFNPNDNPQTSSGSNTEPRWGFPNSTAGPGNPTNFNLNKSMGLLYNWAAATGNQNPSAANQNETQANNPHLLEVGVQGICPNGWHVPSDKEWNILEKELSINGNKYTSGGIAGRWENEWNYTNNWRGDKHGQNMKYPCRLPNTNTNTNGFSLPPENGGFSAMLTGYVNSGTAYYYGREAYIWTSSSYSNDGAGNRILGSGNPNVHRVSYAYRGALFSVRCKR